MLNVTDRWRGKIVMTWYSVVVRKDTLQIAKGYSKLMNRLNVLSRVTQALVLTCCLGPMLLWSNYVMSRAAWWEASQEMCSDKVVSFTKDVLQLRSPLESYSSSLLVDWWCITGCLYYWFDMKLSQGFYLGVNNSLLCYVIACIHIEKIVYRLEHSGTYFSRKSLTKPTFNLGHG